MIKGITPVEEKIIKDILKNYFKEYNFYYYGSRVKGNFEKTSDLDILIWGKVPISSIELDKIKTLFDNSDLSYIVNFSDFNNMDENFYKLIKKDLVKID